MRQIHRRSRIYAQSTLLDASHHPDNLARRLFKTHGQPLAQRLVIWPITPSELIVNDDYAWSVFGVAVAEVPAVLAAREPLYAAAAALTLDTEGQTPAVIAERIAAWVAEQGAAITFEA